MAHNNSPKTFHINLSLADCLALVLSLLAVFVTYLVTIRVFEGIPHIEDEFAYVWQADLVAKGHLTMSSPPDSPSFLVPFVVDYEGIRFGKYPPGWPALLGLGVRLGVRPLVNPLLAGLGVWLTYVLGKKLLGKTVGLLAAGLTVSSPFFLMNSGSLLSHDFGLVLTIGFVLSWLDSFGDRNLPPKKLPTVTAAGTLGVLVLTRPWTAVAVALPFGVHGLYLLVRGNWQIRRHVLSVGIILGIFVSFFFLWQFALTGDALLNPYLLWWPYDKIGFGPGYGVTEQGHTLRQAYINTRFSIRAGFRDLFGWLAYSWIFLPFGLIAMVLRRNWKALLTSSVIASLVVLYLAYWVGSWLFGPRYYFEGIFSLTLMSGAGIAFLAGWPIGPDEGWRSYQGLKKIRPLLMTAFLALLVSGNLLFYTPIRLNTMHGLYGIERADLAPFLSPQAQELTPALVIVHSKKWMSYGALLELEDPSLDTPFIFAYSRGPLGDTQLADDFPQRSTYHYYPEEPYRLYTNPRPSS